MLPSPFFVLAKVATLQILITVIVDVELNCFITCEMYSIVLFLQDVEVKWIEYQNMVNYLIQWIRHHVALMSERNFPNTAVELKVRLFCVVHSILHFTCWHVKCFYGLHFLFI